MKGSYFAAVVAGALLSLVPAGAQSPQTMQRLKNRYGYVGKVCDGRIAVSTEKYGGSKVGKSVLDVHFGYVDTLGRAVIPVRFDYASDFCRGWRSSESGRAAPASSDSSTRRAARSCRSSTTMPRRRARGC